MYLRAKGIKIHCNMCMKQNDSDESNKFAYSIATDIVGIKKVFR